MAPGLQERSKARQWRRPQTGSRSQNKRTDAPIARAAAERRLNAVVSLASVPFCTVLASPPTLRVERARAALLLRLWSVCVCGEEEKARGQRGWFRISQHTIVRPNKTEKQMNEALTIVPARPARLLSEGDAMLVLEVPAPDAASVLALVHLLAPFMRALERRRAARGGAGGVECVLGREVRWHAAAAAAGRGDLGRAAAPRRRNSRGGRSPRRSRWCRNARLAEHGRGRGSRPGGRPAVRSLPRDAWYEACKWEKARIVSIRGMRLSLRLLCISRSGSARRTTRSCQTPDPCAAEWGNTHRRRGPRI